MTGAQLLLAAGILFLLAIADFLFTLHYFHHAKENGMPGGSYSKEPRKPLISLLFGILGTVLLAASMISLVFGLLK